MTADMVPADEVPTISEERLQTIIGIVRAKLREIEPLLIEAYQGRAWIVSGYDTWHEFIQCEFGGSPLFLPPGDGRDASITSLREAGMPLEAIADATGVHKSTVSRTLSRVANATPGPESVTGLDGKVYKITDLGTPKQEGKSRRRPITDALRDATYNLDKATAKVKRISEDDRFDKTIRRDDGHANHFRNEVGRYRERLDAFLVELDNPFEPDLFEIATQAKMIPDWIDSGRFAADFAALPPFRRVEEIEHIEQAIEHLTRLRSAVAELPEGDDVTP